MCLLVTDTNNDKARPVTDNTVSNHITRVNKGMNLQPEMSLVYELWYNLTRKIFRFQSNKYKFYVNYLFQEN